MANNSVLFTNRLVNDELNKAIDQFHTLINILNSIDQAAAHEEELNHKD